jgi:hypothetical protein
VPVHATTVSGDPARLRPDRPHFHPGLAVANAASSPHFPPAAQTRKARPSTPGRRLSREGTPLETRTRGLREASGLSRTIRAVAIGQVMDTSLVHWCGHRWPGKSDRLATELATRGRL